MPFNVQARVHGAEATDFMAPNALAVASGTPHRRIPQASRQEVPHRHNVNWADAEEVREIGTQAEEIANTWYASDSGSLYTIVRRLPYEKSRTIYVINVNTVKFYNYTVRIPYSTVRVPSVRETLY